MNDTQHTQPPFPPEPSSAPAPQRPQQAIAVKQRTPWAALVATAAATALVTSMITTGVVGTPSNNSAPSPSDSETVAAETVQVNTNSDLDWTSVAEQVADSVVAIDVTSNSGSASGSGVIIDADGHIITNNHVVSGAANGSVTVTLADGTIIPASIVGTDPETDLAVLVLDVIPDDLVTAALADSSDVVVGQPVMAVGNPLGLSNTVTSGLVSAINRPVTAGTEDERSVTSAIQIDAAINPGNSGGPLFNASGQVIGITSSIATLSSGGGRSGSIGLGFAIPSNQAASVAEQLIESGSVAHAYLGVSVSDTTVAQGESTRSGAKVEEIVANGPAGNADVQVGDVIIGINDFSVTGATSLTSFVRGLRADDDATLTLVRDGDTHEVQVTLSAREQQDSPRSNESGPEPQDSEPTPQDSPQPPWPWRG